jgi:hypothetical protein
VQKDRALYLARYQATGLMVQFLLGMVIYLIGLPSRLSGEAHTASIVFVFIHVLLAMGLAAGAAWIIRATADAPDWRRWLARGGAAAIGTAFAAGILTLVTSNGWWSFVMAAGFTGALVAYGGLLIPATAAAGNSPRLNGTRPAR